MPEKASSYLGLLGLWAGRGVREVIGQQPLAGLIDLTLNNAMTSAKKRGALIAGCSPAVSLANFGYH